MFTQRKFVILSFLVGLIFTLLFFKKDLGISFFIFSLTFLTFLMYCLKEVELLKKNGTWLFAIPILLLSLSYAITSNEILWFFNFLGIVVISVIMTIVLTTKQYINWARLKFVTNIIDTIFSPFNYIFKPFKILFENNKFINRGKYRKIIAKVLLGLLFSIPFLFVLIALLASADMIFNQMISYLPQFLGDWFNGQFFIDTILQIIIMMIVGTYTWCYFYNLLKEKKEEKVVNEEDKIVKEEKMRIDQVVTITVLAMINILYIIFCVIQFSYLFGGGTGKLPGDFTYAEYARKGFFELILVTIMNIGIILGTIYFTKKDSKISNNIIKIFLILISFATFIMLYSSFFRMRLYEQNYGYTYLRVFVYFFLFIEVIMLCETVWYILKQNFNIIKMYFITFIICYTILNYINIDKMIAKNNIDRYFATGKIDVKYLNTLSFDSIPQMTRLLNAKDEAITNEVREHFSNLKNRLNRDRSFVEYNYSIEKAKDIVNR